MQKFSSPVIALNNFHMGRNQSTPTSSVGIMIKSQHILGGQKFQSVVLAGTLTAFRRLHIKIFIKVEIQLVHLVGDNTMQVDGLTPEDESLKLAAIIATKIYSHLR